MKDSNYLTQKFVGNLYDVSYPVIKSHGSTIGSDCVGCLVITHGQVHFTFNSAIHEMLFCQKSKNETFVFLINFIVGIETPILLLRALFLLLSI